MILLLTGGSTATQQDDISEAKRLAKGDEMRAVTSCSKRPISAGHVAQTELTVHS